MWVCALGPGFQLRPAIPGWSFWLCVFVCALRLYPPVLSRVCVVGLRFRLRPAIPGWGIWLLVLVCVLRLYPVNPGSGVW